MRNGSKDRRQAALMCLVQRRETAEQASDRAWSVWECLSAGMRPASGTDFRAHFGSTCGNLVLINARHPDIPKHALHFKAAWSISAYREKLN